MNNQYIRKFVLLSVLGLAFSCEKESGSSQSGPSQRERELQLELELAKAKAGGAAPADTGAAGAAGAREPETKAADAARAAQIKAATQAATQAAREAQAMREAVDPKPRFVLLMRLGLGYPGLDAWPVEPGIRGRGRGRDGDRQRQLLSTVDRCVPVCLQSARSPVPGRPDMQQRRDVRRARQPLVQRQRH